VEEEGIVVEKPGRHRARIQSRAARNRSP